jgi:hypothetical protein
LIGYNRDNLIGDPIEFIPINIPGIDSVDYNVLIINNTPNNTNPRIKYIAFRGDLRFMEEALAGQRASTLVGQANAAGAIAVGATRFNYVKDYINNAPSGYPVVVPNDPNHPASYLTKPKIESFSSVGGTPTKDINGVSTIRQQPFIVGPDGGNTTVKMGQDYPDWALDGYSNFFGTSAAAPQVAGAVALIMEGRRKFLIGSPATSPDQVKTVLQSTAVDMETPGFDYISGFGLIDAEAAMRTIAAPRPHIDTLIVRPITNPPIVPGETSFTLKVTGYNFSTNSVIAYDTIRTGTSIHDTIKLVTTFISRDTLSAVMPVFESNPAIRVFTLPYTTTNGTDGGYSNAKYFFKPTVVVRAVNTSIKYGQKIPLVLDTIITINGEPLENTTLSLADIGLNKMKFTVTATDNSKVGTYTIIPGFDPNNPPAASILANYEYEFIDSNLNIERMPVTVTPNDKLNLTYGQYIGNVTFTYKFDPAYPPANAAALTDTLKKYHKAFLPDNALALVKDFSKTQSNGSTLSFNDLANMSMMATLKAVKNSRKFQLVNNVLVPIPNSTSINDQSIVDIASESIFEYKTNPALAKFFTGYTGYPSKALVGEAALANNTAKAQTNGGLASLINGSVTPMINTTSGASLVPLFNGGLVYLLNGGLASLVNGSLVPVPNSPQIQLANGGLVYLLNGEYKNVVNGGLVTLLNGQSLTINNNNSYVQLPNNTTSLHLTNADLHS